MKRKRILLSVGGAMALIQGCGNPDSGAAMETPSTIEHLLRLDAAPDGTMRVRSKGKISIRPETPICYRRDGFIIDSVELFRALQQSSSNEAGSSRMTPAEPGSCRFEDKTVHIWGTTERDRNAQSYQLILTIWQGDSYWSGAIARTADNLHSRGQHLVGRIEPPSQPPSLEARIAASMSGDIADLSTAFIEYIRGNEK